MNGLSRLSRIPSPIEARSLLDWGKALWVNKQIHALCSSPCTDPSFHRDANLSLAFKKYIRAA